MSRRIFARNNRGGGILRPMGMSLRGCERNVSTLLSLNFDSSSQVSAVLSEGTGIYLSSSDQDILCKARQAELIT